MEAFRLVARCRTLIASILVAVSPSRANCTLIGYPILNEALLIAVKVVAYHWLGKGCEDVGWRG